MSIRTAILCAALVIGSTIAPGLSLARSTVEIEVPPPVPRKEVIPEARVGYVWMPGYWDWRHHEHIWVSGRYIRELRGYHWVGARWNHEGEHYRLAFGHWEHN